MKCIYCKAEMQRGSTPYHIDRNGYHLLLDKVPAWICSQCGEPYFEEKEVEEVQAVIQEMDKHASKLLIAA
ncbi:MAG: type II toxin-antitoxin system MqsA family antitoxin [Deltaproteobacteria bacterium]|nr:type II toxin-antitoxin system MqsA family antitoxin [Deltaproteobacteria bacterium]